MMHTVASATDTGTVDGITTTVVECACGATTTITWRRSRYAATGHWMTSHERPEPQRRPATESPAVVNRVYADVPCHWLVSRFPPQTCDKPATVWVRVTTLDLISDHPVCAEHAPAR